MKRKWLAIGIILLFVGASVTVAGSSFHKKTKILQDEPSIEIFPSDGLYWNNRKIAEYPVPLFIHYYFKAAIPVVITIYVDDSGDIHRLEFYINGLLQDTVTGAGPAYSWSFDVFVAPFHHSIPLGIKVYVDGEEVISDSITIYRLFP